MFGAFRGQTLHTYMSRLWRHRSKGEDWEGLGWLVGWLVGYLLVLCYLYIYTIRERAALFGLDNGVWIWIWSWSWSCLEVMMLRPIEKEELGHIIK